MPKILSYGLHHSQHLKDSNIEVTKWGFTDRCTFQPITEHYTSIVTDNHINAIKNYFSRCDLIIKWIIIENTFNPDPFIIKHISELTNPEGNHKELPNDGSLVITC